MSIEIRILYANKEQINWSNHLGKHSVNLGAVEYTYNKQTFQSWGSIMRNFHKVTQARITAVLLIIGGRQR